MSEVLDDKVQSLDPKLREIVDDEADKQRGFVYCAACRFGIARASDGIEMNGSHDHQFANPYGIRFHIGCYSNALGCSVTGARNHADTWFPGYFWRIASCAQCQQHLGWHFERNDEFFYGLILDRLEIE